MTLDAARGLLACPVCREALHIDERTARCAHGHSFDIARQGYVNLLGAPEPANADTAAMVAARQRVHAAGVFDQLADAIAAAARDDRATEANRDAPTMLEVGAGTASYLRRCLADDPRARGIALDVSRAAARAAAHADPRIASVVADVWRRLPVLDDAVDTLLAVFAPRHAAEFARVLAPEGRLIVATPGAGHLAALRTTYDLLGIQPDKSERLDATLGVFFEPVGSTPVSYPFEADAVLAHDLIAMGPNAFHRPPERVAAIADRVEVVVHIYQTTHALSV